MANETDETITALGTLKERQKLKAKRKYVVETIFPAGAVHLIGGGSGSGKTTWLLQWLKDWTEGKNVFGFRSFPCSYVYVSFDRGLDDTQQTLERLGMGNWDIPAYPVEDLGLLDPSLEAIMKRFPEVELFVIEGFQSVIPDVGKGQSQNKADMLWMSRLRKKFLSQGKTVIGITHNPKLKVGEAFESARSNFLGSNSLLACTSTLVSAGMPEGAPPDADERLIVLRGRQFKDIRQSWVLDSKGRFDRITTPEAEAQHVNMDVWLTRKKDTEVIETKEFQEYGRRLGMCEATVKRWIKKQVDDGTLTKIRTGTYRRGKIQ